MIQPTPNPQNESQEILLVEDNKTTRILMSSLLKKRGYKVTVAEHGQEALDVFKRK
ncbi:hypothetical protein JCM19239_2599 [Vibrio variabilis]|uniref:Response regulatory domain-containing protein n=1 Tax=Vibrio variabilis TaxID=990271 RepID=A0ABQ0JLP7_9VIBR|nr:hypothetical protein JCM19239_2599 [Vibrio variabilis]